MDFKGHMTVASEFTDMTNRVLFDAAEKGSAVSEMMEVVHRLEALQAAMATPQSETGREFESTLANALREHPEWRQRMAVHTTSAMLRQRILKALPYSTRAVGSDTLGRTFPWREKALPDVRSDCDWPKVVLTKPRRVPASPNSSWKSRSESVPLRRLDRCGVQGKRPLIHPIEKARHNPLLTKSASWTIGRAERFAPGGESGSENRTWSNTPGPATYSRSVPRGVMFPADAQDRSENLPTNSGETIVFGANATCPWKGALGRNINPIDVDLTTLVSAPKYSIPKMRREVSEVITGQALQYGGQVKSDSGVLSPGPIYEYTATMRPRERLLPTVKDGRSAKRTRPPEIRSFPVAPQKEKNSVVVDGGDADDQ